MTESPSMSSVVDQFLSSTDGIALYATLESSGVSRRAVHQAVTVAAQGLTAAPFELQGAGLSGLLGTLISPRELLIQRVASLAGVSFQVAETVVWFALPKLKSAMGSSGAQVSAAGDRF